MARDARVSVVVLTHNRPVELEHCLRRLAELPEQPRLVVVDNASDDGTAEMLLAQPDVVLYGAATDYRDSHYGVSWQQAVLAAHGLGRWAVVADADELLLYPGCETQPLEAVVRRLEAAGHDAAQVLMLDMYPRGPLRETDFARASTTARALPDTESVSCDPLNDYACRIRGKALYALNQNFCRAWDRARSMLGVQEQLLTQRDPLPLRSANDLHADGSRLVNASYGNEWHRAQIVRTEPSDQDKTIKEAYWQATKQAIRYIYIENQYFQYQPWSQWLIESREIYAQTCQMVGQPPQAASPLHVFIVTPEPEKVKLVPRTYDTMKTLGHGVSLPNQERMIEEELRANKLLPSAAAGAPDRNSRLSAVARDAAKIKSPSAKDFERLGLRVLIAKLVVKDDSGRIYRNLKDEPNYAAGYRQIYIHSKLMLADDRFMMLGRPNLNQRSMAVDSEINVSTDDARVARDLRQRVFSLQTGGEHGGGGGSATEIAETFRRWQELMSSNEKQMNRGRSLVSGFIVPFLDKRTSLVRYA